MVNTFHLTVGRETSTLSLRRGDEKVGERTWDESRDMGRQLFAAILEILREQGLKPSDITDFQVETEMSDNFTSVKIAQTVQRTFLFATKENRESSGQRDEA